MQISLIQLLFFLSIEFPLDWVCGTRFISSLNLLARTPSHVPETLAVEIICPFALFAKYTTALKGTEVEVI